MLNIHQIAFDYPGFPVFQNISFELGKGEICGLLGINGSGKSTLFKCCMGFLKVKSGEINLNGDLIQHMSVNQISKLIAYVPQEHQLPYPFLVKEVVLMGRTPHLNGGFGIGQHNKNKAWEAMESLGIMHLADKRFTELSGGQRQLTLIARALAQDSRLLMLDEPTASLDLHNQIQIWEVLIKLKTLGTSILVCTHDPNHVLWFCDRALILEQQSLLADGAPHKVINQELLDVLYKEKCQIQLVNQNKVILPKKL